MIKLLRSNMEKQLERSLSYAFDEILGPMNWDMVIVVRNAILVTDSTKLQQEDVCTLQGIDLDELAPIHTFMKKEQIDALLSDYTPLTYQFMYSYFMLGCKIIRNKEQLLGKGNLDLTPDLEVLISPLPSELKTVFFEDKSLITVIDHQRINLDALLLGIHNSKR